MLDIKKFNQALVRQMLKIASQVPKKGAHQEINDLRKENVDEFLETYNKSTGEGKEVSLKDIKEEDVTKEK